MKHPASGIFGDTNKDTRNSLLKVPGTGGVASGVRTVLMTFADGRATKNTEMTDSWRCAKEKLPWCCNFAKLDIGAFYREAVVDEAGVL